MRAGGRQVGDGGVLRWALAAGLGFAVVAVLAAVAAASHTSVRSDRAVMDFGAEISPLKLSKRVRAPVALTVYGEIEGSAAFVYPPSIRALAIDFGRDFALDIDGLPVCRPSQLRDRDSSEVKDMCGAAIVGKGQATIGGYFPGERLIPSPGELLAINGGRRGGLTRLYLHWHPTEVLNRTLVMPMEVRRIPGPRFGMEATWLIPGEDVGLALEDFELTFPRKRAGKKGTAVLGLRCPRARVPIRARAAFEGDSALVAHTHAACAPMP